MKKYPCVKCGKEFLARPQSPHDAIDPKKPIEGALGWYCSVICWKDIEGPAKREKTN